MMRMVCRNDKLIEGFATEIGGVMLQFSAAWLTSGASVMVAALPGDERSAAVEAKVARLAPRYTIVDDATVQSVVGPHGPVGALVDTPRAAVEAEVHEVPAVVTAAMRWGWSAEDLAGAGKGQHWGAEGGRSTLTGLTMAEMALVPPPGEWETARGAAWPWELDGFRPPGAGWAPPAVPGRVRGGSAASKPQGDDESQDEPVAPPKINDAPDTSAPPPPVVVSDVSALDAEFSAPAVRADVLQVVTQITVQNGGKVAHRNKYNYHLRKAGLPTVGDDELAAFLHLMAN